MENIVQEIEKAYGFKIETFKPAPRGFVAETFCLATDKGKFFIKIINNQRFVNKRYIENMPHSLSVQSKIAEHLDYIPPPIKTINGEFLWTSSNNKAISLYIYIEGSPNTTDNSGNPHGAESDFTKIVPLAAEIYKLKIPCDVSEKFSFWLQTEFESFINGDISLSNEVLIYINRHRTFIEDKWGDYERICERLSGASNGFYITHGDIPGNLMTGRNKKLYIVDWDDVKLAPIERDFWEYMDAAANIQKIADILNDSGVTWTFNRDYYLYYLYTRFFDDLYGYIELDLMKTEDSHVCVKKIKTEVFDWLIPLM